LAAFLAGVQPCRAGIVDRPRRHRPAPAVERHKEPVESSHAPNGRFDARRHGFSRTEIIPRLLLLTM